MEISISTPTRGRLRFAGSALFLSVGGRPVAGSICGFDCTMKPHKFRPHGLILIFAPSLASHRPIGEAKPISPLATTPDAASAINANIFIDAPCAEYSTVCFYHELQERLLRLGRAVNASASVRHLSSFKDVGDLKAHENQEPLGDVASSRLRAPRARAGRRSHDAVCERSAHRARADQYRGRGV